MLRVACVVGPDYANLNDSLMIRAWTDGGEVLLDQTRVWGRRP
jgi:hypothetical protein